VLKELGATAGASPAAAAAKQRGNAAFAAGDNEAALSAYTEAIALAPHDEVCSRDTAERGGMHTDTDAHTRTHAHTHTQREGEGEGEGERER